jgi:hypothetical protein
MHGPKIIGGVAFDTNTLMYSGTAVAVGVQAILFGLLTRIYGMQMGFLPQKEALARFRDKATLEKGLIAGVLIFLVGVAGAIYSILSWRSTGYGPLVYADILRTVIPSAVAIIVGFEVALAAFFMGVLAIAHK